MPGVLPPTPAEPRIQRVLARTMTQGELRALPVTIPVVEAGRAFGLNRDVTYDLLRRNQFPCRTIKVGRATKVARAELLRVLGINDQSDADDGNSG